MRRDGPSQDHALWLLQQLSNFDKHRTLHFVVAQQSRVRAKIKSGEWVEPEWFFGPIQDGAVLARFPRLGYADYEMNVDIQFGVAFDPNGPGARNLLRGALRDIDRTVTQGIARMAAVAGL
jgi:hypothetical protein